MVSTIARPVEAPRTTRRRARAPWVWFLVAVGVLTVAYFSLPTSTRSFTFDVVAFASVIAMFIGFVGHDPEIRFGWAMIAFGVLLLAVGDLIYGSSQPVPSPADMLYVSAYPLLGLGLLALGRVGAPGRERSMILTVVIVSATVATLGLVFLGLAVGPYRDAGVMTRVVVIGYPVLDVVLLALLARPLRRLDAWRVPLRLFGIALLLHFVADSGFVLLDLGIGYTVGASVDAAWLIAYACFGAALLHPAMRAREVSSRGSAWTCVPIASAVGVTGSDRITLHGVTGLPITIPRVVPPAEEPKPTPDLRLGRPRSRALRYRIVFAWSGLVVLLLAGISIFLSMSLGSPELAVLAGAYGIAGSLTLIATSMRA